MRAIIIHILFIVMCDKPTISNYYRISQFEMCSFFSFLVLFLSVCQIMAHKAFSFWLFATQSVQFVFFFWSLFFVFAFLVCSKLFSQLFFLLSNALQHHYWVYHCWFIIPLVVGWLQFYCVHFVCFGFCCYSWDIMDAVFSWVCVLAFHFWFQSVAAWLHIFILI